MVKTVTFTIPNISCQHCVHTIKMEVGEFSGVKGVEVWVEEKKVQIEFEPPATEDKIVGLLTEINYPPA